MSDHDQPPPLDEPPNSGEPAPKIIWLFVAFLPTVLALISFETPKLWPPILVVLVVLDFVCSVIASDRLTRGMKDNDTRGILMLFLILFFLVANVGISAFVGCSQMMRI